MWSLKNFSTRRFILLSLVIGIRAIYILENGKCVQNCGGKLSKTTWDRPTRFRWKDGDLHILGKMCSGNVNLLKCLSSGF
jgi:hypothetical protein